MNFWALILLTINIGLLGAIVYIMLFSKRALRTQAGLQGSEDVLVKSFNEGLSEMRAVARRIEARNSELSMHENGLREKHAALEKLLINAMSPAHAGRDAVRGRDIYASALSMLKSGVPSSEIAKSLGLLSGEAELLNSLHRM